MKKSEYWRKTPFQNDYVFLQIVGDRNLTDLFIQSHPNSGLVSINPSISLLCRGHFIKRRFLFVHQQQCENMTTLDRGELTPRRLVIQNRSSAIFRVRLSLYVE